MPPTAFECRQQIDSVCSVAPSCEHIVTTPSCRTHFPSVSSGRYGACWLLFQSHRESCRKTYTRAPCRPSVFTS